MNEHAQCSIESRPINPEFAYRPLLSACCLCTLAWSGICRYSQLAVLGQMNSRFIVLTHSFHVTLSLRKAKKHVSTTSFTKDMLIWHLTHKYRSVDKIPSITTEMQVWNERGTSEWNTCIEVVKRGICHTAVRVSLMLDSHLRPTHNF